MLDAYCIDKPCSIEDAVGYLRGLASLLAQEPALADDLVEASLTELLASDAAFDPDAVNLKTLFKPLRKALGSSPYRPRLDASLSGALPYLLRESLALHRGANMSVTAIGALLGEPATAIRQRVREAERMLCNQCPAFNKDPIAA